MIPNNPNSISDDFIYTLLEDHAGNIWIGTNNGGLNVLDVNTKKIVRFTYDKNNPGGISDNEIRDIYEDQQNNIWIATGNGGLNLFNRDNKTFKSFKHSSCRPYFHFQQ